MHCSIAVGIRDQKTRFCEQPYVATDVKIYMYIYYMYVIRKNNK